MKMSAQIIPSELDYLKVFQEVTGLINSVHDPQQVMELVVTRLPELLAVDAATIRLLDKSSNSFVLGAAWGVSSEYLSRATIDSSDVISELLNGRPTAKHTIDLSSDHDSCPQIAREGVKSTMSLPILYKDQVAGVLRLLTREPREFSETEISFAMSLATQVGIAICNGRMFQQMEKQVQFLTELRTISQLVNSTLDLDEILTTIVEKVPSILGVKGCTIRLLHPATNRLELAAAHGVSETYLGRGSISREDSIFRVLKGEPVSIFNAAEDPRVDYHDQIKKEGIQSILALPIENRTEIIGVMRLLTNTPRIFTEGEINFAVTMAKECGNAIEKGRTYRKITLLFNQIEENERFLQTILDSLWLQILVTDPDKRIVMANRKFLESTNLSEEETLGRQYRELVPWRRKDDTECPVTKVLTSRVPMTILDFLPMNPGSTEEAPVLNSRSMSKWYERHLTPIVNSGGDVDFVIEAVRDITDQKLLEQEKMERVKLEGVVEIAGTVAHQLNSPLFAALGTAQLLRDDLSNPDLVEDIDTIIRNMKQISDLTEKMTMITGFDQQQYVGNTKIIKLTSR